MKSSRGYVIDERPTKRRRLNPPMLGLQALPEEILVMIFERLADKADLQSVNRVCKQFTRILINPYLWHRLPWPQKDFNGMLDVDDHILEHTKLYELINGDIVALLPDGQFCLLPIMKKEWLIFSGHLDPFNFHTSLSIKHVVAMQYNLIASCADDGICIWDRMTGRLVNYQPSRHPKDKPFRLLCTRHNDLVSASPDGSIYLYQYEGPVLAFEKPEMENLGELKNLCLWNNEIIVEFANALVSWNQKGRSPTIRVVMSELHQKLIKQVRDILSDVNTLTTSYITNYDMAIYSLPSNQGLKFNWDFSFPDHQVEVFYNGVFSFLVDLDNKKPPLFFGLHRRTAAHDASGHYFTMQRTGVNRYQAQSHWSSSERQFKNKIELIVPEEVKKCFVTPSGIGLIILKEGNLKRWDIQNNTCCTLFLAEPDDLPLELADMYDYGNDEWSFRLILPDTLIGVHKFGAVNLWDIHTGQIKQSTLPGYWCDPSVEQQVTQMRGYDFIIERLDAGEDNDFTHEINKQKHICVFRFFQPQIPEVDAMDIDSDIMPPKI